MKKFIAMLLAVFLLVSIVPVMAQETTYAPIIDENDVVVFSNLIANNRLNEQYDLTRDSLVNSDDVVELKAKIEFYDAYFKNNNQLDQDDLKVFSELVMLGNQAQVLSGSEFDFNNDGEINILDITGFTNFMIKYDLVRNSFVSNPISVDEETDFQVIHETELSTCEFSVKDLYLEDSELKLLLSDEQTFIRSNEFTLEDPSQYNWAVEPATETARQNLYYKEKDGEKVASITIKKFDSVEKAKRSYITLRDAFSNNLPSDFSFGDASHCKKIGGDSYCEFLDGDKLISVRLLHDDMDFAKSVTTRYYKELTTICNQFTMSESAPVEIGYKVDFLVNNMWKSGNNQITVSVGNRGYKFDGVVVVVLLEPNGKMHKQKLLLNDFDVHGMARVVFNVIKSDRGTYIAAVDYENAFNEKYETDNKYSKYLDMYSVSDSNIIEPNEEVIKPIMASGSVQMSVSYGIDKSDIKAISEYILVGKTKNEWDVNEDGTVNVADVVRLTYLLNNVDFNEDNMLDDSDVVILKKKLLDQEALLDIWDVNMDGFVNKDDVSALSIIIRECDLIKSQSTVVSVVRARFDEDISVRPSIQENVLVQNEETNTPIRFDDDTSCVGCQKENACLSIGTRLVEDGAPSYCDLDNQFKPQKGNTESCQNNFECESNSCLSGVCYDLKQELVEQRGIMDKILSWFERLF